MAYTPPTRLALRDSIARDLRDVTYTAFTAADLDDFINFGIAEVNRVYPVEHVQEFDVVDPSQTEYVTVLDHIWRVEVWRDGNLHSRIPSNEAETSAGGWELYAQRLRIPKGTNVLDATTDILRAWGYRGRPALSLDAEVAEFDLDAELGCRLYATVQGYQRLVSDRSLFQQWQTQANNSDVSPTQLQNMLALRSSEWDSLRNRIRRIRRAA